MKFLAENPTATETISATLKTSPKTQKFLDVVADCFARTKGNDSADHVSAEAMVEDRSRKSIKIYIAKNKAFKPLPNAADTTEARSMFEEDEVFAQDLFAWFGALGEGGIDVHYLPKTAELDPLNRSMWVIMVSYCFVRQRSSSLLHQRDRGLG